MCRRGSHLGGPRGCMGMFLHRREISEELWQLFGDFPPDRPGGVLKFRGCDPTGDDIVGVDLEERTQGARRVETTVRMMKTKQSDGSAALGLESSYLDEGNVCGKLLLDVLQALQRFSEGREVRDHRPQLAV